MSEVPLYAPPPGLCMSRGDERVHAQAALQSIGVRVGHTTWTTLEAIGRAYTQILLCKVQVDAWGEWAQI